MIIPGQTLRIMKPVEPFHERSVVHGMSFGLGPAGYDIRVAESFLLNAGDFALASTLEKFNMPADVLAQVCDKSSWARRGVAVQNTIIEPGWRGYLTLELTCSLNDVEILAGDPIAQIIFYRLEAPATTLYSGKYQDQEAGPQAARDEQSMS